MDVTRCTDASKEQKKINEEERQREDYNHLREDIRSGAEPDPHLWISVPQRFLRFLGFNHPPPPPPPPSNTFRK